MQHGGLQQIRSLFLSDDKGNTKVRSIGTNPSVSYKKAVFWGKSHLRSLKVINEFVSCMVNFEINCRGLVENIIEWRTGFSFLQKNGVFW